MWWNVTSEAIAGAGIASGGMLYVNPFSYGTLCGALPVGAHVTGGARVGAWAASGGRVYMDPSAYGTLRGALLVGLPARPNGILHDGLPDRNCTPLQQI
jgi:hypothetical protein